MIKWDTPYEDIEQAWSMGSRYMVASLIITVINNLNSFIFFIQHFL